MSEFSGCRLEKNGETVIYFAPASTITPEFANDLFSADRPSDDGTIVFDKNMWHHELTVQGDFQHSAELPTDHANALSGLMGKAADGITARDQHNRVVDFALSSGGAFSLYDFGDEYIKEDFSNVDYNSGVYAKVFFDKILAPREGGKNQVQYTYKFVVGVKD